MAARCSLKMYASGVCHRLMWLIIVFTICFNEAICSTSNKLLEPCDDKPGFRLMGTAYAQHQISSHQNPPASQCRDKKYFVGHFYTSGIGSIVNINAHCLRLAMLLDRIFVLMPDPQQLYLQGPFCSGKTSLDNCYFEPLSSCQFDKLFPNPSFTGVDFDMTVDQSTHQVVHARTAEACLHKPGAITSALPRRDLVRTFDDHKSSIHNLEHFLNNWFFAQTAAYMFRLNDRTNRLIDRRIQKLKKPSVDERPIPQNAVSIFVRGGDKVTEFPLSPLESYLNCARRLFPCTTCSSNKGRCPDECVGDDVVLTTDSPEAVTFFLAQPNLTVHFLNVRRHDENGKLVIDFARERGGSNEFLNHIANLKMSLTGSRFVGTLQTSNWAQLMNILLSTQECKADAEFLDPTFANDGCAGDIEAGLKSMGSRQWMTVEQVKAYREEQLHKWRNGMRDGR